MEVKLLFIGGDRHCPTVPARDLTQEDLDHLARRMRALTVEDLVRSGCYEVVKATPVENETGPTEELTEETCEQPEEIDQADMEAEETSVDEPTCEAVDQPKLSLLSCPAEGCRFVARSKAGLAAHMSAKHKE